MMEATVQKHPMIIGRLLTDEERMEERMEGRMEGQSELLQRLADLGILKEISVVPDEVKK